MSVIMKKPSRDGNLFKFVRVLNSELWIGIGVVVVATSIFLWIFDQCSPALEDDSSSLADVNKEITLKKINCLFCLLL
jgi:hypothetical protein